MGSSGRLLVDNAGDGRDENGEWTGTYHASATIWRQPKEEESWRTNTSAGKHLGMSVACCGYRVLLVVSSTNNAANITLTTTTTTCTTGEPITEASAGFAEYRAICVLSAPSPCNQYQPQLLTIP